jgi:hypothetical protein
VPVIEFFNISYFFYIFILILLTYILYKLLKNRSYKVKYYTLFIMLLSAFLLHFLKLYLIVDYRNGFPSSITYASFENICAVNAIIFPFLYLSNHKLSKDYMIIIGVISGLIAFVIPPDGLGRHIYDPIVIRFYFSHYMIFAVPFLMYKLNMHQVDYKNLFKVMFYLYGVLTIILINEFLLNMLGIVNATFSDYQSGNFRNTAFVFGIPEFLRPAEPFMNFLTPKIFLYHPITLEAMHWPLIWLFIPLLFGTITLGTTLYLIFNRELTLKYLYQIFIKTKNMILVKK